MSTVAQTKYKGRPLLKIGAIYSKPLLGDLSKIVDIENSLRMLTRSVSMRVRHHIQGLAFSPRAKEALRKSLKVQAKPNSILLTTNHPAFKPLILGQKRQQMAWLVKARAPIPIMTDEGLIFRTATAKSMADGKWIHPGHPKTGIIDKAKKEAVDRLRVLIRREIQQRLRDAVRFGR